MASHDPPAGAHLWKVIEACRSSAACLEASLRQHALTSQGFPSRLSPSMPMDQARRSAWAAPTLTLRAKAAAAASQGDDSEADPLSASLTLDVTQTSSKSPPPLGVSWNCPRRWIRVKTTVSALEGFTAISPQISHSHHPSLLKAGVLQA